MTNIDPIAVLGSGPAGLMSAMAASQAGFPVVIISNGMMSHLGGAQFLHAPIPGVHSANNPHTVVNYERRGDPEIYRQKAFGDLKVEWAPWTDGGQPEARYAWSLESTYNDLWDQFESAVSNPMNQVSVDLNWIREEADQFTAVFSSVPLRAICGKPDEHKFVTQLVRISPEPYEELANDTVLYDGTIEKSWYRTSRIFDTCYTEWGPGAKTPPGIELFRDYKPMSTDCDCLKEFPGVLPVGRRGKWVANDFSHSAYYDTMTAIGAIYGR
jgi:hypothetical protein